MCCVRVVRANLGRDGWESDPRVEDRLDQIVCKNRRTSPGGVQSEVEVGHRPYLSGPEPRVGQEL